MPRSNLTPKEVVERGEAIYAERLRARMEQEHPGKFIAVDIDSGDYALGEKDIDAITAMFEKRPQAVMYIARIGHEAAHMLGGAVSASNR